MTVAPPFYSVRNRLRLAALATIGALAGCGGGDGAAAVTVSTNAVTVTPASIFVPPPVATATTAATARRGFGINLTHLSYWSNERAFANLLVGSEWLDPQRGWATFDPARIDAAGNIRTLATGEAANRILTPPADAYANGARIRCTWQGTGSVSIQGTRTDESGGDHYREFTWPGGPPESQRVWLQLRATDAADPVRALDCRERDAAAGALFADEFLTSLKPFGVIRFLDWSTVNENAPVSWATRRQPGDLTQSGTPGVAIEHMIALANAVGADPWFNLPWNADEDYLTRFAQMVHDSIPATRQVYVELGNEVWNYGFAVTSQAEREGLQAGLSTDRYTAALRRYAQKSAWALGIWTKVFADRPGQLVRVVATQNANPTGAETVLGFPGTADVVDALATAPYFSLDLSGPVGASNDRAAQFAALAAEADYVIADRAVANAALARKYGKRFIAYEAGQHLVDRDRVALVAALNRDDRMGSLYTAYMANWQRRFGDVMMLYSSTGAIGQYGAWGLREYSGQLSATAPKWRAVVAAADSTLANH